MEDVTRVSHLVPQNYPFWMCQQLLSVLHKPSQISLRLLDLIVVSFLPIFL